MLLANPLIDLEPDRNLTRQEAAADISKTKRGQHLIANLLDFSKGYESPETPKRDLSVIRMKKEESHSQADISVIQPEKQTVIYTDQLLIKGIIKTANTD